MKSSNEPVQLKYIYETSAEASSLDITHVVIKHSSFYLVPPSGFSGLAVSMLASGTFGGLAVSMLASGTFLV
jgi:hypothetical protein